jgi:hypothetical protein
MVAIQGRRVGEWHRQLTETWAALLRRSPARELDGEARRLPGRLFTDERAAREVGSMSIEVLERRFGVMGADLVCRGPLWSGAPSVDVWPRSGTFVLRFPGGHRVDVEVVDARWQHLLLLIREGDSKSKFLCGRDEREWFVAAIPESAHWVRGVETAMAALRPPLAETALRQVWTKPRHRRRRTPFVRQGEWFFVPAPGVDAPRLSTLRNEPITRGEGSTPHVLEEAFRQGGEVVYVNGRGKALSAEQFEALTRDERGRENWNVMVRDAEVYARGTVRHPDHATIVLKGWHRVAMNTEQSARAMQHVMFLD